MKADNTGSIDLMHFPIEETKTVIKAMKKAEQAADPAALKWCARRIIRLFGLFEDNVCESDEPYIPVKVFNEIWETDLRLDPPPASKNKTVSREAAYRECILNLDFTGVDIQINNCSEALTLLDDLINADNVKNDHIALEAIKSAIERGVILL